jgi:hypothetical protein
MPNPATPKDAEFILKLYDLRREAEMRKARNFIGGEFWPESIADYDKLMGDMRSPHNAWLRQVISFWEMAASLVLHGCIHEQLFIENAGEMFFVYAKFRPLLKDIREKYQSPEFLANTEKLIHNSAAARAKAETFDQRIVRVKTRIQASRASQVAAAS